MKNKVFLCNKRIYIYPTIKCNLNCSYCNVKWVTGKYPNKHEEMDFNKWKKIIDSWDDVGEVIVTGGEPTLYKHLEELVDYLLKKGLCVRIYTNGLIYRNLTRSPRLMFWISKHTEMTADQFYMWYKSYMRYRKRHKVRLNLLVLNEKTKSELYHSCMLRHHFFYSPNGELFGSQELAIKECIKT